MPDDFFLHSIRHIAATKLKDLKIDPITARLMLDHRTFNDVHEIVYVHSDDREQIAAGFEVWASYIERLVTPEASVALLR